MHNYNITIFVAGRGSIPQLMHLHLMYVISINDSDHI